MSGRRSKPIFSNRRRRRATPGVVLVFGMCALLVLLAIGTVAALGAA